MKASEDCVNLIKQFEGCRLTGYLDPVGIPTIGYGHTAPSVRVGDKITQSQADGYLALDVLRTSEGVDPLIDVPLTQGQFDALVSFAYNIGIGRFKRSTMLTLIKGGNLSSAADEFTKWTRAAGKKLPGLVKRRTAEQKLFLGE
jgi:lysozyme